MARTAALFRTHRFSPGIVSEFFKIAACGGVDAFLLADGDRLPLRPNGEDGLTAYEACGRVLPVFPVSQKDFAALELPLLSHEDRPTKSGIKWSNGDYPLYVFRQAFPCYDFYWMLDYDVFFNERDYTPFFARYAANKADFLSASFSPASPDWMWAQGTAWAYRPEERRCSFFPVVRFSAKTLPALLERRRELGRRYSAGARSDWRWLGVELFVPTEMDRLGFSHALLDNLGTFHCGESMDLGEDRVFEHPDGKLYHPVKGDFAGRLRRGEKRVRELEEEVRALRARNAELLAALEKRR